VYAELKDQNFVIIAVAFDAGGNTAVKDWIRPATIEIPKELQTIMGWDDELVSRAAAPTYPCLVDEKHLVAELYNMVNVPSAVWINEDGRIVRPAETAGASDGFRQVDFETFQIPEEVAQDGKQKRQQYVEAVRDWVQNGDASRYTLSAEEARARVDAPTAEHALAAAHYRLGQHLFEQGHVEAAHQSWAEAKRLRPESWNYFRQDLEVDEVGKASGPDFFAAVQALGDKAYYPPARL
jgi:hypothetical protein